MSEARPWWPGQADSSDSCAYCAGGQGCLVARSGAGWRLQSVTTSRIKLPSIKTGMGRQVQCKFWEQKDRQGGQNLIRHPLHWRLPGFHRPDFSWCLGASWSGNTFTMEISTFLWDHQFFFRGLN